MSETVQIRDLERELGTYPHIVPLNPSFKEGIPTIKLTLEIDWDADKPFQILSDLQERLAELCPSLDHHQCRGPMHYRIFPENEDKADSGKKLEASLALAHLIEHVMIDNVAYLTDARTISGVTGALKESKVRFDVFVECPDPYVGPLATHLALGWTRALLKGKGLNGRGRPTLDLGRYLYRRHPAAVNVTSASKDLGLERRKALEAIRWLEEEGFACWAPQTMNFSGDPHFQYCVDEPTFDNTNDLPTA